MNTKRVLMAMSGGIDSSVAAMVLMEGGCDVIGCTFTTEATPRGMVDDARELADRLGIKHLTVAMHSVFREEVINAFVAEYKAGRTPNPCVRCNERIKWGEMLKVADAHDCGYIATGHYARVALRNGESFLRRAEDTRKDQTYFLWRLTADQLRRTLFPLGNMTKAHVRAYAQEKGFANLSQKAESQEICFISGNDYRCFLRQEGCVMHPGDYVDASGRVLGHHEGYPNYTIGQRKGLGIALGEPAFVTRIEADANRVTLGCYDDLLVTDVVLSDTLFRGDGMRSVWAQIRYRSQPTEAMVLSDVLTDDRGGRLHLRFREPVWAVTPGQSAVIYQDDLLVGGGVIEG